MGIKWTKEQNRVINERNGTLLVSASAGSGKTTVMLERVIKLIDEGYGLENMLISTFTNAAAEDMRLKLYKRLRSNNEDGKYSSQLNYLPQADICTLHSWCQKIIKSHFYAVDVDPCFEILDDKEAKAILEECIKEALSEKLGADGEFVEFYDALLINRRDNSMRKIIGGIIEFAFAQPNTEEWLKNSLKQYQDERQAKAFVNEYDSSRRERLKLTAEKFGREFGRDAMTRADELKDYLDGKVDSLSRFVRKSMDESAAEEYIVVRDKCKAFVNEMQAYEYAPSDVGLASKISEVVLRAMELFASEKKKRVKLDYNDLERYALQVLLNPVAAKSVKEKYDFVFVDEYQDINPLQESIIAALNADGKLFLVGDIKQSIYAFRLCNPQIFVDKYNRFKSEGRAVELNANFRSDARILDFCNRVFSKMMTEDFGRVNYARDARFVVGDNGADVKEDSKAISKNDYAKKVDDEVAATHASNLSVAANILSVDNAANTKELKVDDEVAATHTSNLSVAANILSVDNAANIDLIAAKSNNADGLNFVTNLAAGGVEVKIVKANSDRAIPTGVYDIVMDDCAAAGGAMEAEVNLAADKILELIQSKAVIKGELRDIALKDIAVLLRSPGQFAIKLYDKLKLLGIDAELGSSLSFADLPETNALISYLRLIDNRRDDINLAAVMLSHFGGFNEEELAEVAAWGDKEYFYERVNMFGGDKAIKDRITKFYERLNYYTSMSDSVSVDELAGSITANSGYFEYLFSQNDGAAKAHNLDAYLKTISDCPFKANVSDYVNYILEASPTADRAKSADAVKIMTVHASKGLEFPFVILADTSKKFNLSDSAGKLILSDRFGIALKNIDLINRRILPTYLWRAASITSKRQNLEEEMRILYVALTRAQNGLYIFGRVSDEDKYLNEVKDFDECDSYLKWLKPFIMNAKFVDESECLFEPPVKHKPTVSKPDEVLTAKISRRLDGGNYHSSPHLIKSNVTALSSAAEEEYNYTFVGGDTERAAERGTAYHKFMELIDFSDAERSYQNIADENPKFNELVNKSEILDACKAVLKIKGDMGEYREQSFVFNAPLSLVGLKGEGSVLTQGVIDLLLTDGNKAVIVDYKTTAEENLNSPAYVMQCTIYRQAVQKILNLKVEKTMLYSFKMRKFIDIT